MELLGFYDEPFAIHGEVTTARAAGTATLPPPAVAPARLDKPAPAHDTPRANSRSSLVQQLWDTTEFNSDILDKWRPTAVARRKLGGADLRASTLVWFGAGVVAVVFLIWFFGARPAAEAEALAADVVSDALALESTLDPLRAVAITLGDETGPDLVGAATASLATEEAGRALFSRSADLDDDGEAGAIRAAATSAAGEAMEAATSVSRLSAYRLSAERALVLPALPSSPTADDITEVTQIIADWRSSVNEVVADLPSGLLAGTTGRLEEWRVSLQTWQEAYLDGLRQDDTVAMAAAVTQQDTVVRQLRTGLIEDVDAAAAVTLRQIESAADGLESLVGG